MDHPTDTDVARFRAEMRRRGLVSETPRFDTDTDPDAIDFGPAFAAFCTARLFSTAVRDGNECVDLLTRSARAHGDLSMQLNLIQPVDGDDAVAVAVTDAPKTPPPVVDADIELSVGDDATKTHAAACTPAWDCYLAFIPFQPDVARTPLHEFRCYCSAQRLRCIAQYSYLHKCPLPREDMRSAALAISDAVSEQLKALPEGVVDAAIDVRCVPCVDGEGKRGSGEGKAASAAVYDVSLIEVNPLGPGCVWGTVDWDHDKEWLLGRSPPPPEGHTSDQMANTCVTLHVPHGSGDGWPVVVRFTGSHASGVYMGGLAHMPPAYLAALFEDWALTPVFEADERRRKTRLALVGDTLIADGSDSDEDPQAGGRHRSSGDWEWGCPLL